MLAKNAVEGGRTQETEWKYDQCSHSSGPVSTNRDHACFPIEYQEVPTVVVSVLVVAFVTSVVVVADVVIPVMDVRTIEIVCTNVAV
jgi:hypothetical protein